MTHRQSLHDASWHFRAAEGPTDAPAAASTWTPATVPGCVHTDLMAAGQIGDPAIGSNELDQQWIGGTDWEYRCQFNAEPALFDQEVIDLVCEGLDTVASLELNGVAIGAAANMFHPHRFRVSTGGRLRRGQNELLIRFTSPTRHIREQEARLGARPVNGDWDPYIFIRKAACNFGWDWGPKVATSGIWKPIRLEAWSEVRVAAVRPIVSRVQGDEWRVDVSVDLQWGRPDPERTPRSVSAGLRKGKVAIAASSVQVNHGEASAQVCLNLTNPPLWWPRGHGSQPLIPLEVSINGLVPSSSSDESKPSHEALDQWSGKIGFREVRLKSRRDADGSAFTLSVNDRDIFCKGFNWIPDGLFPAQLSRETCRDRLRRALDANANMVRVWGGGSYESDEFYGLCDELGLLVWQDFMFACAMYPEEAPFPALIEAEARHQISRLSAHASVALWCGGNECIWAHDSWGNAPGEQPWKDRLKGQTWGRGYYLDLLPRLVRELDPSRPYWANSPWSGDETIPSNSADHGDRHTWDLRGDAYRTLVPRFCSELGHQSPANYATLERAIGAEGLALGSAALSHRQRATGGTPRHIDQAIASTFREPRSFDEWHFLAQLNQARALQVGLEWLRINQPRCMGALVWQFNDAWPGLSWSVLDSSGARKPAFRAVADSFQSRLLTIQPVDGRLGVYAVNDNDEPWEHRLELQRLGFGGTVLAATEKRPFSVPPRGCLRLAEVEPELGSPESPDRELIVASTHNQRRTWFFLPDKELQYPEPALDFGEISWGRGGGTLRATARTLIRDLTFVEDRLPGTRILPQIPHRTLLPGESFSLSVQSETKDKDIDAAALLAPPLLWCVNWFGKGS